MDVWVFFFDCVGILICCFFDDIVYIFIVEFLRLMMVVVWYILLLSSYNLQKQCVIFVVLNELFFEFFGRNIVFSYRVILERREYLILKERCCSD